MKLHTFLAAAAVFSATALSAQSVQKLDEEKYSVTNGDVTLVVDAAHGAKILSFKLGEQEVIAQKPEPPAPADGAPAPRMRFVNPNSYGSTFWTSPQAEWNWPPVPEYDSKPYEAEATADAIVLTGQVSKYGYRVRKAISADSADGAFIITYSIINESGEVRKVAPWAITRVPNGGYLEFDAKAEDVTPLDLMKVSFGEGPAKLEIDVANQNRKINVDGKGWLKFHDNGLVLTQKFPDITPEAAAPGEAEIQVYIDARKSFVEIEAQGPYTELQPGEKLDWTVRWYLAAEE
ncbi:MAG: hypothetical protein IKV62_09755 [Bacteroidales bacterium]|nr:hypothetical protein [Bacteroidales bacterium]